MSEVSLYLTRREPPYFPTVLPAVGPEYCLLDGRFPSRADAAMSSVALSGDTTPCKVTPVILHGVVLYILLADVTLQNHSGHPTRGSPISLYSGRDRVKSLRSSFPSRGWCGSPSADPWLADTTGKPLRPLCLLLVGRDDSGHPTRDCGSCGLTGYGRVALVGHLALLSHTKY
jgi:hypothetical protein